MLWLLGAKKAKGQALKQSPHALLNETRSFSLKRAWRLCFEAQPLAFLAPSSQNIGLQSILIHFFCSISASVLKSTKRVELLFSVRIFNCLSVTNHEIKQKILQGNSLLLEQFLKSFKVLKVSKNIIKLLLSCRKTNLWLVLSSNSSGSLLVLVGYGISLLGGVRPILVKVVLFQLFGRGHSQDDAPPSFFLNSKSPILGISNDISFVSIFSFERWLKWPKRKNH